MTNIPGIADEAGTGLESQIRATKALGWHHVELRAVEVPGCPTANVHTVVLFRETNAAPTDEHAMGLNYVEYGRRVCSSLSVSDSFKGLHRRRPPPRRTE